MLEVLQSGWITTGERTARFEEALREYVGTRHAVAVNSATAALHLALEALGVGPGDEVVVPTYTFAACGEVVVYLGARPVLADVDPATFNVTRETAEDALTPRTRAILVVHFAGLPAEVMPLLELGAERGIPIVEDAAHALPASRAGRAAGTWGRAGAYSFYATKTVTTGEGGMLVTDEDAIADRARLMRLHGLSRDAWSRYTTAGNWAYEIEEAGFKYNMTDLAAALGLVQLGRAEEMRRARERIAATYQAAFTADPLAGLVEAPPWPPRGTVHAWHLYPLRLHGDRMRAGRDAVVAELRARGIGTSVHFIPLHLHPYYRRTFGYMPDDLPIARREYEREISLPIYPDLSAPDLMRVIEAVGEVVTGLA